MRHPLSSMVLSLVAASSIVACSAAEEDVEDGANDTFGGEKGDDFGIGGPESRGVRALVNDPAIGVTELDVDVGLSSRAARNIIEHRNGPDGIPGTADDDPYETLAELDGIPYVGPATLKRLLDEARSRGLVTDPVIGVYWRFEEIGVFGIQGCPTGFDTIDVVTQPVDAAGQLGDAIIDRFDCGLTGAMTSPLTPGTYQVHYQVTNDSRAIFASSVPRQVEVGDGDAVYEAAIIVNGGYMSLAWKLVGAQSGNGLKCADVTALTGISSIATSITTPTEAVTDIWTCEDGAGVTGAMLAGTYTVSVSAINAANLSLGTAAPVTNVVVRAPNQVTDLGTINIPVDGL